MNPIAFAYGRVSSETGTGASGASRQEQSLEIQDRQFREYVLSVGLSLDAFGPNQERVFLERHTGAFTFGDIRKRPEGARLWNALTQTRQKIAPEQPIHLIFSKVDRFSRGWLEGQILLRDLRNLKVTLHIIALGGRGFDCESNIGQKILSDLLWVAEMEVQMITTRIRENKSEWRSKGLNLGGSTAPFGWNLEDTGLTSERGKKLFRLMPNSDEQKWIVDMARLRQAGWGYHSIAKWLNDHGATPKRGKGELMTLRRKGRETETRFTSGRWQAGNVAKVLNNKTTLEWLEAQRTRQREAA